MSDHEVVVLKLNPAGNGNSDLVYSTYLGGPTRVGGEDRGCSIALDGSGRVYVTGRAGSSDFQTTPGAYQSSINGTSDAFMAVFNPTLSELEYSTFLGGSSPPYPHPWFDDCGFGIAVDQEGTVYVTGQTGSGDFPTTEGAYDTEHGGVASAWAGLDGFVVRFGVTNQPPVAVCQDFVLELGEDGTATLEPSDVDGGSYDPDEGDEITLSLDKTDFDCGDLGEQTVILTVTDNNGASASCEATVTVVDVTPPVITAALEPLIMWPPNHKYETFTVSQFVTGVSDNCTDLTVDDVVITKVSSDEPEDAKGGGDGKTKDDMVIASDCKSPCSSVPSGRVAATAGSIPSTCR